MWTTFVMFAIASNMPPALREAHVHLNLARDHEAAGRLASAYREVNLAKGLLQEGELFREVEARSAQLARRVSYVTLDVRNDAAGVIVEQDGERVPSSDWGRTRPIDGGNHVWTARIDDFVFWRYEASVLEGGVLGLSPGLSQLPPSDELPPE